MFPITPVPFQLVMNNLKRFEVALRTEKALFQVETLLAAPDVVLHPQANEVYKLTLQSVRDCVEGWVVNDEYSNGGVNVERFLFTSLLSST